MATDPTSLTSDLLARVVGAIAQAGGWVPFDRFMAMALYEPGLGYYANDSAKFGHTPQGGSDFVTAPELTPLFGHTLARQVAQALDATGTDEVWEFGAGSGALALQLLDALGDQVQRYTIVDLSGSLRARQQAKLVAHAHKLRWLDALPEKFSGVVVGNEVLDAMPVHLMAWDGQAWNERGVALDETGPAPHFVWADRPAPEGVRPPTEHADEVLAPGTVTETHGQAEAFVTTLAQLMTRGAAFFVDYGFPEAEYYLPQRTGGTLMCHHAHRSDPDPLSQVGEKDITAHVNFTGVALAGQEGGWEVLGYTSQGRFLMNCGLGEALAATGEASNTEQLKARHALQMLVAEHEMGELFKVLAVSMPAVQLLPFKPKH